MNHHVNKCKHGVQLGQCRCASPNKQVLLVKCPASHQDWSESEHPVMYTGSYGLTAVPVQYWKEVVGQAEWPTSERSYTVIWHEPGDERKEFSRFLIDQGYLPAVDFIQREGTLDNSE